MRLGSIQQAQENIGQRQSGHTDASGAFEAVLNRELDKCAQLTFSKHAGQRLTERGIGLTAQDLLRLDAAVKKAEEKGVRNTLVLMDRNAFIINVPTGTVITAMGGGDTRENVFTQIDGAVIA